MKHDTRSRVDAAASSAPLKSAADIESFMYEYYAAWQGTDEDRIGSYYAEHVTVQIPGTLMLGRAAVREQFVRPFITGFPGNRHVVKNMVFGRNVVVVEFTFDAQHKGPFAGRAATDARVQVLGTGVYEFDPAARQITAARIYFDVETLVQQLLDPRYQHLVAKDGPAAPIGGVAAPVEYLDLATVIAVSQSISGEMTLDKLLDVLMRAAVEQAGAERALLILSREVEPRVAAEATTSEDTVMVHLCDEPVTASRLPETVLHYVLHTRESVILDDAATLNHFSTDPYVSQRHARSVCCLPLTNQAKLIGVLYLENNRAPRVFAQVRTAVLKLLASQAAISLESAGLYRELEMSEAELRRAHAHLTAAQRLSQTGSFTWDVQADDHTWSEEIYRIFGFEPGTKVTMPMIQSTIHPEDMSAVAAVIGSAVEGGNFDLVFRIVTSDGVVKHAHVVGHRNAQIADRPVFMGAVQDVTASKTAEEALRDSERNARLIVDTIPGFVAVFAADGELELVNPQILEYFGKTLEELKPWGAGDMFHPEDRPHTVEVFAKSMASGEPLEVELRARRGDGVFRWFQSRAFPLQDANGHIVRWYNLLIDIDERKRAEEAQRESERRFRLLVETIPALVWMGNSDGELDYLNERAVEYLGHTVESLAGGGWIELIDPDHRDATIRRWLDSATTGLSYDDTYRLRRADGQYRWIHSVGEPFYNGQGRIVHWYGLIIDIDDQRRAEAALGALKDQLYKENLVLRDEVDRTSMFEEIVGTSKPLNAVLSRLSKVAPTDSTVLITGETGTGKELVARAIHRRSARASRPFVSVNCAAVPRELIASELFGHEKGAFTGATQRRLGRFELANGGTIFLDEVGELPMETQVALLRILQEREFERVGGSLSVRIDVRVITATNRDLQAAIEAGTFRSDLFYRLNVFPLAMPALRERADDIPLLVEYFIDRYARKAGKTIRRVNKRTLDHLRSYPWPGNVRELQNVIERSVIVCETDEFTVDESWLSAKPGTQDPLALSGALAAREKALIEEALRASGGRVFGPSGAAERLGIPRSTLESKIRALRINKDRFRS